MPAFSFGGFKPHSLKRNSDAEPLNGVKIGKISR